MVALTSRLVRAPTPGTREYELLSVLDRSDRVVS